MEEIDEDVTEPLSEWDRYPPHIHNGDSNPEDELYWGIVRLPGVTPFRGRARMGRGGRILIDRAPSRTNNDSRLLLY